MKKTIFIDGLGRRNPISDYDQIVWFLLQMEKTSPRTRMTRYYLDFKEQYGKVLIEMEAFELLAFVNRSATTEKILRREKARIKAKEIAEKEMENIKSDIDQWNLKRELINLIRLN